MYVCYYVFESFCNIFTPVFLSSQNTILKSICALSLSDHEWIIVKLWKHFYATTQVTSLIFLHIDPEYEIFIPDSVTFSNFFTYCVCQKSKVPTVIALY